MIPTQPNELLIRAAALYLPIALVTALLLYRRPSRRAIAGAVLATSWNLVAILAVNAIALRHGWWEFASDKALVAGTPADLWVGWSLLWGATPVLLDSPKLLRVAGALIAADVILMPLGDPLIQLSDRWLIGEAVAAATCLAPGVLLGRWTATDTHLSKRATLQVVGFAGLLYYVLPELIFTITAGDWDELLSRPRWHLLLAGVLLVPVTAMALQAVVEFTKHGGTPVPLDPPKQLVTTGPYAFVANPMQLSGTILLAAWGALLREPAIIAAAIMGAIFSAGVAAWSENRDLSRRFGDGWMRYRDGVRFWIPRWRPMQASTAVVYVASTCDPCSEVGRFLERRDPIGLEIRAAEECAVPLRRISYVRGEDRAAGVAAIGRCLEHANLGWAGASWITRTPGVAQVLQLIADAVGAGPRSVGRLDVGPEQHSGGTSWPAS